MDNIHIDFGALSPKISSQLASLGLKRGILTQTQLDFFQEYADALTLLALGDLLSQTIISKGRQRLFKQIVNALNSASK